MDLTFDVSSLIVVCVVVEQDLKVQKRLVDWRLVVGSSRGRSR